MKIRALLPALALLALAGCSSHAAPASSAASATPPPPAASTAPATPVTAAAAKAAAVSYFALYAAGQYAAVDPMLDAQARAAIPEATWVTVHQDCRGSTSGLSYKVGAPVLAGTTAVMSVSLAGVASSLGSEEESFVYEGGKWLWAPPDLASYKGTPAQIVAKLKAAGICG